MRNFYDVEITDITTHENAFIRKFSRGNAQFPQVESPFDFVETPAGAQKSHEQTPEEKEFTLEVIKNLKFAEETLLNAVREAQQEPTKHRREALLQTGQTKAGHIHNFANYVLGFGGSAVLETHQSNGRFEKATKLNQDLERACRIRAIIVAYYQQQLLMIVMRQSGLSYNHPARTAYDSATEHGFIGFVEFIRSDAASELFELVSQSDLIEEKITTLLRSVMGPNAKKQLCDLVMETFSTPGAQADEPQTNIALFKFSSPLRREEKSEEDPNAPLLTNYRREFSGSRGGGYGATGPTAPAGMAMQVMGHTRHYQALDRVSNEHKTDAALVVKPTAALQVFHGAPLHTAVMVAAQQESFSSQRHRKFVERVVMDAKTPLEIICKLDLQIRGILSELEKLNAAQKLAVEQTQKRRKSEEDTAESLRTNPSELMLQLRESVQQLNLDARGQDGDPQKILYELFNKKHNPIERLFYYIVDETMKMIKNPQVVDQDILWLQLLGHRISICGLAEHQKENAVIHAAANFVLQLKQLNLAAQGTLVTEPMRHKSTTVMLVLLEMLAKIDGEIIGGIRANSKENVKLFLSRRDSIIAMFNMLLYRGATPYQHFSEREIEQNQLFKFNNFLLLNKLFTFYSCILTPTTRLVAEKLAYYCSEQAKIDPYCLQGDQTVFQHLSIFVNLLDRVANGRISERVFMSEVARLEKQLFTTVDAPFALKFTNAFIALRHAISDGTPDRFSAAPDEFRFLYRVLCGIAEKVELGLLLCTDFVKPLEMEAQQHAAPAPGF